MRPSAKVVTEAARAYAAAVKVTNPLIHQLADAVAQDMANEMGGAVRIILPGGVVIERAPQGVQTVARLMRA